MSHSADDTARNPARNPGQPAAQAAARAELAARVRSRLGAKAAAVETYLTSCMADRPLPPVLRDAMEYSLLAGGKRVRPCLCLTFADGFGLAEERALPFAAAIECIHTYSLIHDDLPAMDDDDMRRGRPSSHKAFGEATAILAGDGLLTEAFLFMTYADAPAPQMLEAMAALARAAGAEGMVGGQVLDMEYTGRKEAVTLEELRRMHAMKTGALIQAACECGAVLAGVGSTERQAAAAYGRALGAAFQIADDILDEVGDAHAMGKPVGSDRAMGKSTYVSLLGLERSRALGEAAAAEAVAALAQCAFRNNSTAAFLRDLARYVVERAA